MKRWWVIYKPSFFFFMSSFFIFLFPQFFAYVVAFFLLTISIGLFLFSFKVTNTVRHMQDAGDIHQDFVKDFKHYGKTVYVRYFSRFDD